MVKYIIYALVGSIFVFELIANNNGGPFSSFIVTTYMSIFWLVAILFLYDFFMSMMGNNSKYMIRFHEKIKNELIVNVIVGVTLLVLFMNSPASYSLSNIDIASSGLPFLATALLETKQSAGIKIANRRLPKYIALGYASIQLFIYGFSAWLLSYILAGQISGLQSLWVQLSILFAAIAFFFGAKQITYILTEQRMEVSPALLSIFQSLPQSPGLYKDMVVGAHIWNEQVRKEKSMLRKERNRKRK